MRFESFALLVALGASPSAALFGIKAPFMKKSEKSTWVPPKQTSNVEANMDLARGWTPRPTSAPRDRFGLMELKPRIDGFTMNSDTCGYVASQWDNSFTCNKIGATCTNDGKFMGCCSEGGCSAIKTKCLDYTDSVAGLCKSPSDFHTVCCSTSLYPVCYNYIFSTTATPGSTFTLFDCDTSKGTGVLLDYAPSFTRGRSSGRTTNPVTPTTTTESTSTESETSTSTTSSQTQSPTQTSSSGGGAPVGAIVGGTVGGLAALGIAGLGIFWFLIRKKRTPAGQTAPMGTSPQPPMAQTQPPTSPSSPGSQYPHYASGGFAVPPVSNPQSPGGYNPHQSMYDPNMNWQQQQQQPYQPGMQPYPPPQQAPLQQYPPQQAYNNQYQAYSPQGDVQQPPNMSPSTGYGSTVVNAQTPPPLSEQTPPLKDPVAGGGYYVPGQNAQELASVNPVGLESNRAELGSGR